MPECTIRMAEEGDAEAMSRLGRETFIQNFGHMYHPQDLEDFLDGVYMPRLQLQEIRTQENFIQVAECGGRLVGYAKSGPCKLPVPHMPPRSYEVQRLYLDAGIKRAGIGSRLMRNALDHFAQMEAQAVYLGVWSGNHAAQAFYARFGFRKIGEYHFMVGGHADDEWIMQLEK